MITVNDSLTLEDFLKLPETKTVCEYINGKVIAHCLKFGCQMGWLIEPKDRSILMMMPDRVPELYQEDNLLVFLEKFNLSWTANDVFSWLTWESYLYPSWLKSRFYEISTTTRTA